MKTRIIHEALARGFEDCRITTAAPAESGPRFQQWLAAGCHGEMDYLRRQAPKRLDPQLVLPGARSVIVLAASYSAAAETFGRQPPREDSRASGTPPAGVDARGWMARYARFADYHDALGKRLKAFAAFVNSQGGAGTRSVWYVDTGPVLERDWAQRAGLGFIGKHTNLISRHLGNWLFLGEILTTLELPPDRPEKNRCGSCVRCLAACPTGAITAPFLLDARRCISYLTIELRGSIPEPLRPAVGKRIFGCDDCLEVCPWNRFARAGAILRGSQRPDLAEPNLLELLALDETGFRQRFQGTPIYRSKRRGLLRNVCVALGNVGTKQALPALAQAAQDRETLVAEHARWAIQHVQSREV